MANRPILQKASRCALFLGMAFACGRARAQSAGSVPTVIELDLPSYQAELDRCADVIHHPNQVPQFRASLPRTWRVRTGQTELDVSTDWLVADLRRIEQNPATAQEASQQISQRLTAMRDAAAELQRDHDVSQIQEARAHRDKILQRPEFAGAAGPSQLQILLARVERWLVERLIRLFARLHLGAKASNVLAWTVVVLAFLVLACWIGKNLVRAAREHTPRPAGPPPAEELHFWAKDALAAAERGDYREAVHCAYWAAVVHLENLGLLKRDRSRTPRESLRLLERHPKEQKALAEFTRRFEVIWYGYRPASQDDWLGARAHLESMGCLSPSTLATASS